MLRMLSKLTSGECKESPFFHTAINKMRILLKSRLDQEGYSQAPRMGRHPLRTHMDFVLVVSLLKAARDPDAEVFLQVYATGKTWLGVDEELPRTPAVYPEKRKWKFDATGQIPKPCTKKNALSTIGHEDWIKRHFHSQWEQGRIVWVLEQFENPKAFGRGYKYIPRDVL